jgi:hypothetical protein
MYVHKLVIHNLHGCYVPSVSLKLEQSKFDFATLYHFIEVHLLVSIST